MTYTAQSMARRPSKHSTGADKLRAIIRKRRRKRLATTAILAVAASLLVRVFILDFELVSGASMQPTLEDGTLVLVLKVSAFSEGDIVVAREPLGGARVIKRVGACGGSLVQYMGQDVVLSDGQVFLLGDNPQRSVDSRNYGPVDDEYIIGKVICIF